MQGVGEWGEFGVGDITTSPHDKTGPYRLTAGKLYVSKVCISILAYFQQARMKSLPASLPANSLIQC